jgi:D-alanyl-D-alanine carboxypeptidase/D-alanyl-D-alanine-endopeptidase (penicillin-binding protein 4)
MSLEREVIYEDDSMDVTNGEIQKVEKIIYHLTGRIPVNTSKTWRYYRSILQPEQFFQENFIEMLKQHGVGHRGKTGFKGAPEKTISLVAQTSDPLRVLIGDMNKYSRNLTAESLILEMAAQSEQPATTQKGISLIEQYLADLGVWEEGTVLHNGSGLSPTMQLKPSQVSAVFLDMYDDPLLGPEYFTSLSVGGRDGTLRRRFQEDEYTSRVRGKTGSINGVYCVATYVLGGDGDVYVLVYFANKLRRRSSFVRNLQNEMIQKIIDHTGG